MRLKVKLSRKEFLVKEKKRSTSKLIDSFLSQNEDFLMSIDIKLKSITFIEIVVTQHKERQLIENHGKRQPTLYN